MQKRLKEEEEKREAIIKAQKSIDAIKNKYINDLEHIRDCYYLEKAEQIKNREIFKSKPHEGITKWEMWKVEREIEKVKYEQYINLKEENIKLKMEIDTYKQARREFEENIKNNTNELYNKFGNHIPRID